MTNEVTFEKHLRMESPKDGGGTKNVIRGLEHSASPHQPQPAGNREAGDGVQKPMARDLMNFHYIMKPL